MMTNFGLGTPLTLDSAELVVRNRKTGEETRYALGGFRNSTYVGIEKSRFQFADSQRRPIVGQR